MEDKVMAVLRNMEGTHQLMAQLLYGCGLRLMCTASAEIGQTSFVC